MITSKDPYVGDRERERWGSLNDAGIAAEVAGWVARDARRKRAGERKTCTSFDFLFPFLLAVDFVYV